MLNKEQKIEVYEKALLIFNESDERVGQVKFLCNCIGRAARDLGHISIMQYVKSQLLTEWMKENLPEFYAHKPKNLPADLPWWPTKDKNNKIDYHQFRKNILETIIKELHQ